MNEAPAQWSDQKTLEYLQSFVHISHGGKTLCGSPDVEISVPLGMHTLSAFRCLNCETIIGHFGASRVSDLFKEDGTS